MATQLAEDVVLITTPHVISTELSAGLVAESGRASCSGSVELGRRLLLAAKHGNTQLVLELMAKGAPFTTDWLGTSPLHVAAAGNHVDTCGVLLRAGVSRDSRTKVERTALHLAAHAGHASVCALLLDKGAHVDCRDMLCMTPLHWAAERGHTEAVAVLLQHGADPAAASKFLKTPLTLAAAKGHAHIVTLMEEAVRQREAKESVDALKQADEQTTEIPAAEQQQALESIERLQMQDSVKTFERMQTEPITIDIEPIAPAVQKQNSNHVEGTENSTPDGSAGGAGGGAGGGAAALLRKHGITLLPHDSSTTVLNAIQSGRSIVLSDAGKLMLKDTPVANSAKANSAAGTGVGAGRGVILTAAAVRAPPAPGVKIFTLNNKLRPGAKLPVKRVLNPTDLQIKVLNSSEEDGSSPRCVPSSPSPARVGTKRRGGGAGAGGGVKIIVQKNNIEKLLGRGTTTENGVQASPVQLTSTTELNKVLGVSSAVPTVPTLSDTPGAPVPPPPGGYMCVPAEFLSSTSTSYLRSQLLAAHRTIHELNQQLDAFKQRLAKYEPA